MADPVDHDIQTTMATDEEGGASHAAAIIITTDAEDPSNDTTTTVDPSPEATTTLPEDTAQRIPVEDGTIQILGLGDAPVVLKLSQLHGNRSLLLTQPDNVRLEVRAAKRNAAAAALEAPPTPVWRPYTGRQYPEGDAATPTLFGGRVYSTFQHALLGLLLWSGGGLTGSVSMLPYPNGTDRFPHFVITEADSVLPASVFQADDPPQGKGLAVHLLAQEPGPSVLASLASELGSTPCVPPLWGCMVLIGALRPSSNHHAGAGGRNAAAAAATHVLPVPSPQGPQLRGILIRTARIPRPVRSSALPLEAVEHGWFPCLQGGVLRFAYHSQEDGEVLPAAGVPVFQAIGYRLWRKGQTTYAIIPRSFAQPDASWDGAMRAFLLEQQVQRNTTPTTNAVAAPTPAAAAVDLLVLSP